MVTAQQDEPERVDLDLGAAVERVDGWVDGAIRMLPNVIVGAIVLAVFVGLSFAAQRAIGRTSRRRGRDNLGQVLGGFVRWVVVVLGVLLAATIVFPTLHPGDLVAGLGITSVAIGFAFKDILQNWLAGILILVRQPFQIGDQIEVKGFEGTVLRIEARATLLDTYDGQRVVIPNSDIFTNAVLVKTANPRRRTEYDVGIGYGDDVERACGVLVEAVRGSAGVDAGYVPEALPWDLAASWVTIRLRWWTASDRASVVATRANVIRAIRTALAEAGIDIPFETHVQLMHDQTEAADGDRAKQREGWPAAGGAGTRPRWRAIRERRAGRGGTEIADA